TSSDRDWSSDVCSSDLRRAAVAGAAAPAVAGDGADQAGAGVDPADGVVLGVDDVEVAGAVDGQFLRAVEGGFVGGAAVAGEALRSDERRVGQESSRRQR